MSLTYSLREVVRKMPIDFNLESWSASEVDFFNECSANQEYFSEPLIFEVEFVETYPYSVEVIDNGIEDFVARLQELYAKSNEFVSGLHEINTKKNNELRMFGVLRYGSNETHFKRMAMCINHLDEINMEQIAGILERSFCNRVVTYATEKHITPAYFAKKCITVATTNQNDEGVPCAMAMLSYGVGYP